ncbi:hypothetical protein [Phaeodactylibacter xiamenensis]|jgi:hypothetical protein|uniref:hypothetical protein n=1 Tax=Phaeodactylibacter xiamenensis TaxID=1524460 RepID=UPI0024A82C42|nr:hypothetical protein [Phaeodactylibacter xiamenensis]
MRKLTWLPVFMIAFMGCQKEAIIDTVEPDIHILAPTAGAVLSVEDVMPVEVDFSENLGLHTYFIWLIAEDGMPTLVEKQHLHALRHEVRLEFPLNGLEPGTYELQVTADDHDQNTTNAAVTVHLQ